MSNNHLMVRSSKKDLTKPIFSAHSSEITVIPDSSTTSNCSIQAGRFLDVLNNLDDQPPKTLVDICLKSLQKIENELKQVLIDHDYLQLLLIVKVPNDFLFAYCPFPESLNCFAEQTLQAVINTLKLIQRSANFTENELDLFIARIHEISTILNSEFGDWIKQNEDSLIQLWCYIDIEQRINRNQPDTIHTHLNDSLSPLNDTIEYLFQLFSDKSSFTTIQAALNDSWDTIQWLKLPNVERQRELWFEYQHTNKIGLPVISNFFEKLDLFKLIYCYPSGMNDITESDQLVSVMMYIKESLNVDIAQQIIQDIAILEKPIAIDHLIELTGQAITAIKNLYKNEGVLIDHQYEFSQIETRNDDPKVFTFYTHIAFLHVFSRQLIFYRIKSSLDPTPNILEADAIKTERQFFLNRPIPDTNAWINDYLLKHQSSRQLNKLYGRDLIAKTLISILLMTDTIEKHDLAEILRWDYSRILAMKTQYHEGFKKHLLFLTTQQFIKTHQLPIDIEEYWNQFSPTNLTLEETIERVISHLQLQPEQMNSFIQLNKKNALPTSSFYQSTLSKIACQLHQKIIKPTLSLPDLDLFPVTPLYTITSYLIKVHQSLFNSHYNQFIKHQLISLIRSNDSAIPVQNEFLNIQSMIQHSRQWLHHISLGIAAMRIARQYAFKKRPLLKQHPKVTTICNSISQRLAPLFRSFFSLQPVYFSTDEQQQHFESQLQRIIQGFIADLFQIYHMALIEHIATYLTTSPGHETVLSSNYTFLDNTLAKAHDHFQSCSSNEQDQIISHLNSHYFLPDSYSEFTCINDELNTLLKSPISFKFHSNQFEKPLFQCKSEISQLINQIFLGHLIDQGQCPIDSHLVFRIKNYFKIMEKKLNLNKTSL